MPPPSADDLLPLASLGARGPTGSRLRPARSRLLPVLAGLAAALAVAVCASAAIGAVIVPLADVLAAVSGRGDPQTITIVWELRLPRVATALAAGAALGVAGLLLQTLFRNPLADPWSLGIMSGAQLGVAVVVTAGALAGPDLLDGLAVLHQLGLVAGAMGGAAAATAFITWTSRRVSSVTLLVTGLMVGYVCQGLVSVVLHFTTRTQGRVFDAWNDGSFARMTWEQYPGFVAGLACAAGVTLWLRKPLNALILGERYASTLGLHVRRTRRVVLLAALLLSAPITAFCGPIAFLGLVASHLARGLVRNSDHRVLVPVTAMVGALLAVTADFAVHLPWRQHFLHLNAVNGLIGAPVVIAVLLRQRRSGGPDA